MSLAAISSDSNAVKMANSPISPSPYSVPFWGDSESGTGLAAPASPAVAAQDAAAPQVVYLPW